jgi:hypothetical protein
MATLGELDFSVVFVMFDVIRHIRGVISAA